MGDLYAILALRRKRAKLAGEIEKAERALAVQRLDLANLDAVIWLFETETDPDLIPSIRPVSRRCLFLRNREQMCLCCDVLRDTAAPMRTLAVAVRVMAAKELPTDQGAIVQSTAVRVRVELLRLEKKGMIGASCRGRGVLGVGVEGATGRPPVLVDAESDAGAWGGDEAGMRSGCAVEHANRNRDGKGHKIRMIRA